MNKISNDTSLFATNDPFSIIDFSSKTDKKD